MRNASAYEQYYLRSSCITNAVADAESRLATTTASATTANPSRSIGR